MLNVKFFLKTVSLLFFCLFATLQADPPATATPPTQTIPTPPEQAPITTPPSSIEVTGSYENAFMKMLLTLLGLVVLLFITVWVLRRLSQSKLGLKGNNRGIKILERRSLSPKSTLFLIEVEGKKILIGESQLEIRHLTTVEERFVKDEP